MVIEIYPQRERERERQRKIDRERAREREGCWSMQASASGAVTTCGQVDEDMVRQLLETEQLGMFQGPPLLRPL